MSAPERPSFESDGPTRLAVRLPLLPLVQRAVLVIAAMYGAGSWLTLREAVDDFTRWLADPGADPLWPGVAATIVFRLLALVLAGTLAAQVARLAKARPRAPREATTVRADERGLHAGDRLVVARADVARVEVTTDADLGFAVVVTTTAGATVRAPMRAEAPARQLAAALGAPTDPGALVFEGVSGSRAKETIAALLAALSVVLVASASGMLELMSNRPMYWGWFNGWEAEIPWTFAWWLSAVCTLGLFPAGVALARALGPVVRRLAPGKVTVSGKGVEASSGLVTAASITGVTTGDAADATLALSDGQRVRIAFGPERALTERELFVARVREIAGQRGETSGVRVAREAAAAGDEEESEEEPLARRAR